VVNSEEVDRIRTVYAGWEPTLDRGNPGYLRSIRERDAVLKHLLLEEFDHTLPRCRVLDVGCGYGSLLDLFHQQGVPAEGLFGVDLIPNRTETARKRYPGFTFINGNAERLEFPDKWFDFVTIFTVFSSILDREMAKNVARNIVRILAAGGVVVWYDMRYPNPWNGNVKAMTKPRIRELFPSFELQLKPLTLLPPLARHLGRRTESVYPLLAAIPILRSHYLGLLRPR
jgi:ubiquinone/menaquinone biosynthesis C-methylase UbiE